MKVERSQANFFQDFTEAFSPDSDSDSLDFQNTVNTEILDSIINADHFSDIDAQSASSNFSIEEISEEIHVNDINSEEVRTLAVLNPVSGRFDQKVQIIDNFGNDLSVLDTDNYAIETEEIFIQDDPPLVKNDQDFNATSQPNPDQSKIPSTSQDSHGADIKINPSNPKKARIDIDGVEVSVPRDLAKKICKLVKSSKKNGIKTKRKEEQDEHIPTIPSKMYRKIEPPKEEEVKAPVDVFEFYDEEDEERKLKEKMEIQRKKELQERTCQICKEVFKDPMDVLRHKRQFHASKRIILPAEQLEGYLKLKNQKDCPVCGKRVSENGYHGLFYNHLLTHCYDAYIFSCKVCGLKFKRKDHLRYHERRHIVPPPSETS